MVRIIANNKAPYILTVAQYTNYTRKNIFDLSMQITSQVNKATLEVL